MKRALLFCLVGLLCIGAVPYAAIAAGFELTGTATVFGTGNVAVTGNGTKFTTELVDSYSSSDGIGDTIKIGLGSQVYTVVYIGSDTQLIIDPAYQGTPGSGLIIYRLTRLPVVASTGNNVTITDSSGAPLSGANDVTFTWDGTLKTSVAESGQISNATLSSLCPVQGAPWSVHDMAIYGPGTYTVFTDCEPGSPGCGQAIRTSLPLVRMSSAFTCSGTGISART